MPENKYFLRFLALRPHSFLASISSVLYGLLLSYSKLQLLNLKLACLTILATLFLHSSINIANDYFDYKNRVDSAKSVYKTMVNTSIHTQLNWYLKCFKFCIFCSILIGAYIVYKTDYKILITGITCIIITYLYSGGKKPLANLAFGEFLSFFFFGPVACCGTYYIQCADINNIQLMNSISIGFLVSGIMIANNIRDIETDKAAGKNTFAVRYSEIRTKKLYLFLIFLSYVISISLNNFGPLLTTPLYFVIMKKLWYGSKHDMLKVIELTTILAFFYSICLGVFEIWNTLK